MGKTIFLHAGAHRTGSSSFQMCLHANRVILRQAGYDLAYPGRDDVPGGRLKMRLPGPRHGPKRLGKFVDSVRSNIARLSPDPDRALILSEENVSGRMFHFYEGAFFPAAGKRFAALREGLGDARIEVVFLTRRYSELYVSAYRKRAEDNPVEAFDDLVPAFLAMDRGWPDLLAEMRDVLRPERLAVLPYERRGESRSVLARLVPGIDAAGLKEPSQTINLSASDAALEALQARYQAGETLDRVEWKAVIAAHAQAQSARSFAVFDEGARQMLDARYDRDMQRLADLQGITLL